MLEGSVVSRIDGSSQRGDLSRFSGSRTTGHASENSNEQAGAESAENRGETMNLWTLCDRRTGPGTRELERMVFSGPRGGISGNERRLNVPCPGGAWRWNNPGRTQREDPHLMKEIVDLSSLKAVSHLSAQPSCIDTIYEKCRSGWEPRQTESGARSSLFSLSFCATQ